MLVTDPFLSFWGDLHLTFTFYNPPKLRIIQKWTKSNLSGLYKLYYNYNKITKDLFITFWAWAQALGATELAPWRPQVNMTLVWTHSELKPSEAKNCLEISKYKKGKSKRWQIKMGVFFFIAHGKGFKYHAQPQTGAYSY